MNLEFGMVPKITLGDLTFTAFRGLSLNTHTLSHMHTHRLKHTGTCMPSHGTHTHTHVHTHIVAQRDRVGCGRGLTYLCVYIS